MHLEKKEGKILFWGGIFFGFNLYPLVPSPETLSCVTFLCPCVQQQCCLCGRMWLVTQVLIDSSKFPTRATFTGVVSFYLADLLLLFLIWFQSSPIAAALPVLVLISGEALQKEENCSFSNRNRQKFFTVSTNCSEVLRSLYTGRCMKGQDGQVTHLGHFESAGEIKRAKLKPYFWRSMDHR